MKKSRAIEILTDTIKDYETAVQNEREHPLYGRISSQKYINDLEKGIEALRFALRALEREGWIPVAERLPEEGGCYLCCWQGKTVDTGFFCNSHFRLYGEIKDHLITAWMPLPEPYGGDNT